MRYLLDVNALVAFGFLEHTLHERVAVWMRSLGSRNSFEFVTCSITELGFVRILSQAPQYGFRVAGARVLLEQLKKSHVFRFSFIVDDQDISKLPAWVKTPAQTTDGHLLQLARAHGATLVTLDQGIPGAFVIPDDR